MLLCILDLSVACPSNMNCVWRTSALTGVAGLEMSAVSRPIEAF
jgi:hypothetical protein